MEILALNQKHIEEFSKSSIEPIIARLNFKTLTSQEEIGEYLFISDQLPRTNTGRLSSSVLRAYSSFFGGWWCSGLDPLNNWEPMEWGCFKSDEPRMDVEKLKPIKYEHPPKMATRAFFLRVPRSVASKIADRYGFPLPVENESPDDEFKDFWPWALSHNIPIVLCEGAKKTACLLSLGFLAIGLPGIWGARRVGRDEMGEKIGGAGLIPELEQLKAKDIIFCFDQDVKQSTREAVGAAISASSKLFSGVIKVAMWPQELGKGIDDIPPDLACEAIGNAASLERYEYLNFTQLHHQVGQFRHERFLGDISHELLNHQWLAIKSPKGSGKSFAIAQAAKDRGGRRILNVTHRIQLGSQMASRLQIPHSISVVGSGYSVCIDSLHPKSGVAFSPDDWKGAWIVIDEINQLIHHLLNSSTCQKHRSNILKNLRLALLNALEYGGRLILADADLNSVSLGFIERLLDNKYSPYLIINDFHHEQKTEYFVSDDKTPAPLVGKALELLKEGKKILLLTGGQRAKSRYGSQCLEAFFRGKGIDSVLRIDSESIADPGHEAYGCIASIDDVISKYQMTIATPTIETGVSIEVPHFDYVFLISQGVQSCDSVRQFAARYRLPVARYVWLSKRGISKIGSGASSYKSLISAEYKKDKSILKRLHIDSFSDDLRNDFHQLYLPSWAKIAAVQNFSNQYYREEIINRWKEEHNVSFVCLSTKDDEQKIKSEIKVNKEEFYNNYIAEIVDAEPISDTEYAKLERQQAKTKQQRSQHKKATLERIYKIEISQNLVKNHDSNYFRCLQLHYYLIPGKDYLTARDIDKFDNLLSDDGEYFLPDSNRNLLSKKIDALNYLGLPKILEIQEEFSNKSPIAVEIQQKIDKNWQALKLVLGSDLRNKTPMGCVQRLLGLIGFKCCKLRREGARGHQQWIYSPPTTGYEGDRRDEIFDQWLARDSAPTMEVATVATVQEPTVPTMGVEPTVPTMEVATVATVQEPTVPTMEVATVATVQEPTVPTMGVATVATVQEPTVGVELTMEPGEVLAWIWSMGGWVMAAYDAIAKRARLPGGRKQKIWESYEVRIISEI